MSRTLSTDELREEIIRLGPWHLDVEVTPEISTRVSQEAPSGTYPEELGEVSMPELYKPFMAKLRRLYQNGLEGRTMLDCGCNCGGYLFWAKEYGAGDCFGFDVREHWIRQARFLVEHRTGPSDGIHFEVCDLYDLPKRGLEPADITLFNGLFYHLPDPITGLKIAADLTNELIIVSTATRDGLPDGLLAADEESRDFLMEGVYGLMWRPTGPEVLDKILRWTGFVETHVTWWKTQTIRPDWGRLEIVAAKTPGLLDRLKPRRDTASKPLDTAKSEDAAPS
jgi:SAM-dependent methyltransferase